MKLPVHTGTPQLQQRLTTLMTSPFWGSQDALLSSLPYMLIDVLLVWLSIHIYESLINLKINTALKSR